MDNKNKPIKKFTQSIEIFVPSKIATDEIVKEKLQKLYKGNEILENSIVKNKIRFLSFKIYGNLSSRSTSVVLHELFKAIIKIEGVAQFIVDGTLFELDSLSNTTELSSTTFKLSEYTKDTNIK